MVKKSVLALAFALCGSQVSRGNIIGLGGDGSGYSLNTHGSNGGPVINSNVLTLTDQNMNEANSVFGNALQNYAAGFTATFTYTDVSAGGADGFAFVLQNDPRGAAASGGNGGSLGFGGGSDHITNSLGITFNLDAGNGGSQSGIDQNGNVWYESTGSVDITNGSPVDVTITYDAADTTVFETLTQGANSFTQSQVVDLNSTLGNDGYAYAGFTAGTGDTGAVQTIGDFTYQEVPEPAAPVLLGLAAATSLARRRRGRVNA